MATLSVDQCQRLLCQSGFSVAEDFRCPPDGRSCWRVDLTRQGRLILAQAPSREEAWQLACRLATVETGEADEVVGTPVS